MLRVRFHGRGGHGIKTASRILGTAAFLCGLQAQDSPLYGAERRGAPVAASTRIDHEPIRERGIIPDPDLILVADETLLADPAAGVLTGQATASLLFVNSARKGPVLAEQGAVSCPVATRDLTDLVLKIIGKGSALSAVLGAAACALAGLRSWDLVRRAVQEEFADLRLSPEAAARNLEAAGMVLESLPAARLREAAPSAAGSGVLAAPAHLSGPEGFPVIHAPGNSCLRHTGTWRVFRPVIDRAVCTRCGICFALCPDGAITLDAAAGPVIDYDHCKGCMTCRRECPLHCIHEEQEVRAW